MSIRTAAVMLATAALSLLALVPATAGAHTGLRLDPGDGPLTGVTTFTSTTSDGFFLNAPGTGQLGCTNASFDADVVAITAATTIPGQLTAFTAQGCTDTFPVLGFTSCHLHDKVSLHVTSTPTGGTVRLTDPVLRCETTGVGACYFTSAIASGIYTNATSTLAFENVAYGPIAATSDSLGASCGNGGTWSVTFTHVVAGTATQTLTVRQ
jgi:hypothetical protein